MQVSDTSYIITFITKGRSYNTTIFDPVDGGYQAIDRFIASYTKANPNVIDHTKRMLIGTPQFRERAVGKDFLDVYEVVK
jgi:hypothetical protein